MKPGFAAPLAAIVLLAGLLAGCRTLDRPRGWEPQAQAPAPQRHPAYPMAEEGAAERRRQAMSEAGIAPLAGGEAGYYMGLAEEKLRGALQGSGASVTRVGQAIIVNMPGSAAFAAGSAAANPQFDGMLAAIAGVIKEYDRMLIDVTGHADGQGSAAANMRLSEERARMAANRLIAQGTDARRFIVKGAGAREPIASDATAGGRAQNRRVEIRLTPYTDGAPANGAGTPGVRRPAAPLSP